SARATHAAGVRQLRTRRRGHRGAGREHIPQPSPGSHFGHEPGGTPGRGGVHGVQGTAALLDKQFRLLWRGCRTALPRHQTLSATLDWSYNLLTPTERLVLRRLAVFVGGFSLEAVLDAVAESLGPAELTETRPTLA